MLNNPLCFTTSYKRPTYIYNTIISILNQSYKDFTYSINICIDNDNEEILYRHILNDIINDTRISIMFSYNDSQHENYMKPILNAEKHKSHDVFIKIDDDDLYHKNYIEKMLEHYTKYSCDVISLSSNLFVKNDTIIREKIDHVAGIWALDTKSDIKFGLPPTYVFNRKAYDVVSSLSVSDIKKIHIFEDAAWRYYWRENNITSYIIDDTDNIFTLNRHGQNVSEPRIESYRNKEYIDINNATICIFKHPHWISYVYLNKTNNKIYNIENDDHGSYSIDNDNIVVEWDRWGKEVFSKKLDNNTVFYAKE